jgi:DNA-directed RNA polymerase subunit RPC12/RpoP
MAFAAALGKCVKCGKPIRHWIEPTGRMSPPFNTEYSDGWFYPHLNGELCPDCDDKTPLKEKDPDLWESFQHIIREVKRIR